MMYEYMSLWSFHSKFFFIQTLKFKHWRKIRLPRNSYELFKNFNQNSDQDSRWLWISVKAHQNYNSDGKVRIFDLRKRDCISSWSLKAAASEMTSSILTLQMSSDETSIYALSSDGQFSAWSFIQTSQKMFEVQLNDPYFSSDAYPRAAWGKQFAFAGL